MSRVGTKHTLAELRVRTAAHARGLRFRLHRRDLPGTPDMVFPKRRLVLFVNGCFWHRHAGCKMATTPKTRQEYWHRKFTQNVTRDVEVRHRLNQLGWRTETIWECETRNALKLSQRLDEIFGPTVTPPGDAS